VTPPLPAPRAAAGYTLVELFLTVAVLMMLLGLVVNMGNRLRQESLDRQARHQLQRLTAAIDRYAAEHAGRLPDVTPLIDPAGLAPLADPTATGDPPALRAAAARNRDDVRRALGWPPEPDAARDPLTDPWSTPIVLMPKQSPAIGMAPGDRFFFVSAGPDRQFLTRADNLYSYDYADAVTAPPATAPAEASRP
jgi:type II secretory pathway pseudopilin PulG